MIYDLMLRDSIVPYRGDFRGMDTRTEKTFSVRKLDEIAPLVAGDEKWMGENCIPSAETIERVQARIEAARRLKYGV